MDIVSHILLHDLLHESRPGSHFAADGRLAEHHRLDAVRAHLREMFGGYPAAVAHYGAAACCTTSLPEQR